MTLRRLMAGTVRAPTLGRFSWSATACFLALALPGFLSAQLLCDLVVTAREQVASLEQDGAEASADLEAKTERLITIKSNMEDSEEQEAFQKAKRAHDAAQAERKTLRKTFQELEYSEGQFNQELDKYTGELAAMALTRRDLNEVEDWPEVKRFRERAAELESTIRVLIGGASFDDLPGLVKKMSFTGHLDWLRGGNLDAYVPSAFLQYEVPFSIAEAGGQLGHAQANLAVRVHWYGDPKIRAERGSRLQAGIRSYANLVFELQTAAAAQLGELDRTLKSLAEAMRRAGVSGHTARPSGFRHGALSEQAYENRRRELEALSRPIEAKLEQHKQEKLEILRRLVAIDRIAEDYRRAERALRRAGAEVPAFERKRLEQARRQRNDAEALLVDIGVRLRIAGAEVESLEAQLVQKVAQIQNAIEAAGAERASANAEAGRHEQCRLLVSLGLDSLAEAESVYNEIAGCLSGPHGQLRAEMRRVREQIGRVACGPGESGPPTPTTDLQPPPEELDNPPEQPDVPPVQPGFGTLEPATRLSSGPGCSSLELVEGFAQTPPVEQKFYQNAIAELRAAGLAAFAYEFKMAARQQDNGLVTNQEPAACAVVALGTTVRIAYNSNYTELLDPPTPDEDVSGKAFVPNVLNRSKDVARALIEGAGLSAFLFELQRSPSPDFDLVVTWQKPTAGELVDPGTLVEAGYNAPHDSQPARDTGANSRDGFGPNEGGDPAGAEIPEAGQVAAGGEIPAGEDDASGEPSDIDDSGLFGQGDGQLAGDGGVAAGAWDEAADAGRRETASDIVPGVEQPPPRAASAAESGSDVADQARQIAAEAAVDRQVNASKPNWAGAVLGTALDLNRAVTGGLPAPPSPRRPNSGSAGGAGLGGVAGTAGTGGKPPSAAGGCYIQSLPLGNAAHFLVIYPKPPRTNYIVWSIPPPDGKVCRTARDCMQQLISSRMPGARIHRSYRSQALAEQAARSLCPSR